MKRIIALLIASMVLMSTQVFALEYGAEWSKYESTTTAKFTDISGHWAENNIKRAYDVRWIDGYPDHTFRPNNPIKRGEAITVFTRFLGIQASEPAERYFSYSDLLDNGWMVKFIEPAKKLLPQYTDGVNTPVLEALPITREDVIYALVIATKYDDRVLTIDQSVLDMFSDKNSISAKIKPYVAVAVTYGLVSGYDDGTIGGTDPLTRAEFATLLAKASTVGNGTGKGMDSIPDYVAEVTVSEVGVYPSGMLNMQVGEEIELTSTARMSNGELTAYQNINPQSSSPCVQVIGKKLKAVSAGNAEIRFLNDTFLSNTVINITVNVPNTEPRFNSINYDDVTTGSSVTISGRVSDTTGSALTLTMNGEYVSITSGKFDKQVDLNEGSNTFTFVLTNGYGISSERVVKIKREMPTLSPVSIIEPNPTPEVRVVRYEWSADPVELNVGETYRIKLLKIYSDGTSVDVTSRSNLLSSNRSVATIDTNGNITAIEKGTVEISFMLDNIDESGNGIRMPRMPIVKVNAGSSNENEGDVILRGLEWSSPSASIAVGATASIKLWGVYSDGSKKDLTEECGVYVDDVDIAEISGTTVKGKRAGSAILWFESVPTTNITLPVPCEIKVTE